MTTETQPVIVTFRSEQQLKGTDKMTVKHTKGNCAACGKRLINIPSLADTRDDQVVYVGNDCHTAILKCGENGYLPPKGGVRLYAPVLPENLKKYYERAKQNRKA